MARYSEKKISRILFALMLLFMLLLISVSFASAVTISTVGTMADTRGWLFSQSTPFGIYYGFGTNEDYYPFSDLYYFDFATKSNTLIKSQTDQPDIKQPSVTNVIIWGESIYSAIVGDKIFISNLNYHNEQPWDITKPWDANGLYVIDTKTNTFYLYDRLPFDFFVDSWPSPMAAVGSDLYFFVGIPNRTDIARRVYKYNPATKETTALAYIPKDSESELGLGSGGIVFAVKDKIYITTYYTKGSGYPVFDNSIYVYDTLTDTFTNLTTSSLIPSNNYRANSVVNGKLYFVGGDDPFTDNPLDKIVEYNISTNQFSVLDTLKDENGTNYKLAGASTTSLGGSLYVVGGEQQNHFRQVFDQNLVSVMAEPFYLFLTKDYKNRGDYISYVAQKTNEYLKAKLITKKEKSKIMKIATELAKTIKNNNNKK